MVIGGGLIGIETCEALQLAGIEITVVELLPQLLTFLDWELAKLVENHVRSKGANVITGNGIAAFLGEDGKLDRGEARRTARSSPASWRSWPSACAPTSQLATEAGLEHRRHAAASWSTNTCRPRIRTSMPPATAWRSRNRITGKKVHAPYGDLANLQGRVAGENAVLGNMRHLSRHHPDRHLQDLRLCGRLHRPFDEGGRASWA